MRAPKFWERDGSPLGILLQPAAAAYTLAGRWRRAVARPWRAPVPVLCVGALTVGGAGKTPTALALAAALEARGVALHFLTRGYGGTAAGPLQVDPSAHDAALVGDEALLLGQAAPCWLSGDRVAGARAAIATGAEAIVMDDGFQNPSLTKDLSLLVIDGGHGLGNGRVLPAGPLREPIADGLARAGAVVLIGADDTGVAARLGRCPVLRAKLVPSPDAAAELGGQRVLAFAGIGRPTKFFATLRSLGAELAEQRAFPDHHRYTAAGIDSLLRRAEQLKAIPVTTAKDAMRLPKEARAAVRVLPVQLQWQDAGALDLLLARVLASRLVPAS
jgi:tetraacyldisaccharide 4'-kinase